MIKKIVSALVLPIISIAANAQYCTNVGPSSTADSNLQSLSLTGETTSINFVGCPGVFGLDDQTSVYSADIAPGNSYTADVVFGTCGGSYNSVGCIWIDFNGNQVFESNEIIGTWSGMPPSAVQQINFTVPMSAVNGTTRMRVVHYEGGSLPFDACASFTWGSTTDFGIVIGQPIDCSGYVGDDMSDPRIVSAVPYSETYDNSVCYTNNVPVYSSPDVFYRLTPQDYGVDYLNVSLCGSMFDTYLQIQDTAGNVLFANDDYNFCAPQSEITFPVGDHDTLYVIVQGWSNNTGIYDIAINDGELVNIEEEKVQIDMYPNPATDIIKISGVHENHNYSITDIKGRTVLQSILNQDNSIDISELSAGIYILELEINGEIVQKKLIKQ